MILVVDAGNTRIKWQVRDEGRIILQGAMLMSELESGAGLKGELPPVSHVAVSTVASECHRERLASALHLSTGLAPRFYWAEHVRGELVNAYPEPGKMGADRWHAMYGAWRASGSGLAVVDAGSAITVDYVRADGRHLGGYILPGRNMMLRSLQSDAARIGFEPGLASLAEPGTNTGECVLQGQAWLFEALQGRLAGDISRYGLDVLHLTGGDAGLFDLPGLPLKRCPSLVLDGLDAIVREDAGR